MDHTTEIAVALPLGAWRFLLEASAAAPLPHQPRADVLANVQQRIDAAIRAQAPSPEFSPGVPQVNFSES